MTLYAQDTGDADLERLQALANVTSLDVLEATQVTDDWLKRLTCLSALRHLVIHDSKITGIGLAHLSALTSLRTLDLTGG